MEEIGKLHFIQNTNICEYFEMAVRLFWCEKIWLVILQLSNRRGWAGIFFVGRRLSQMSSICTSWPLTKVELFHLPLLLFETL